MPGPGAGRGTGELRAVNYSRHWPTSGAGQSPATAWAENIPQTDQAHSRLVADKIGSCVLKKVPDTANVPLLEAQQMVSPELQPRRGHSFG